MRRKDQQGWSIGIAISDLVLRLVDLIIRAVGKGKKK